MATIRMATEDDAAGVQAIYAPIVRTTAISFELEPPTVSDMRRRIVETLQGWPWLVCEQRGAVLGYVYASLYRVRFAYQWSVDVTVYIGEQHRRCGVGRALYTALFRLLTLQGFYNAYAGITLPNVGSVALHESLGFEPVGVYRSVGFKLGSWHDVGWWQLALQPRALPPDPPSDLNALRAAAEFDAVLANAAALLRV